LDFLKLFVAVDVDFNLGLGMLSATINAINSAQNCPNLQKSAQRRNFEIPPKNEILVFFKNKNLYVYQEALEYISTVWIFNPRIFHMLFLLSKNGLCM
jgi:hypothetical protein